MFQRSWLKSTACLLLFTFPLQSVVAASGGAVSAPVPQAEQANADPLPEKEGVRHEAERPSQTPDFAELGKAAKALGKDQAASLKDHAAAVQEGTVTVPQLKDGRFKSGNTRVHVDDLFPGTRRDRPDPDGTYFSKGQKPDLKRLKQLHDPNKGMGKVGQSAKKGLWKDAQGASPSLAGSAYQVILDASKRSRPDFAEDPALDQSKRTYEKIDDIAKWFGDCKSETGYKKRERLTHVPEYHRCTRLYKPAGGCTIQHTIEIDTEPTDVVFLVDNSASMDPVIADLRNNVRTFANLMMQGKAHNLRMGGAAYRDKDYLWNNIPFSYAYSDFQHWINGVRTERAETYPFAVVRWAIDHYPWRENVHRIIVLIGNDDYGCGFDPGQSFCPSRTEIIRALQEKGIQLYIFHNNPDVRSIGIPLADYFAGPKLLKFAQFFTIVTDHWSPQSCINDARATLEPFCKGRYTPWPRDENACVTISGFDICKGDPLYQKLKAPPLPNVPRQAARIEVSALKCDYNHGQGTCWVDAQGRRQCLRNDQDIDQCQAYEHNPACGFVSSTCIGGTQGVSGHCYVRGDTYDCGKEVKVPTLDRSTKYRCAGPVRCMGEDCLSVDQEASTDFAKAAALLQAAQFMTQDTDCEDVTGHDNLYCRAFTGQPSECKVAVGGVQNCCKNPQYPSLGDYLTLILSMPKLDTERTLLGCA
ncbi:conjugal transfer protein TraN [Candidatus Glomeribacter gigasporarum]|uniref:conjugal transfer protein TraN n=1 Tax=Candidatus Glomeribacter gigasporarum TaxID=132144 RepID=UPI0002F93314|nr:conjugal transfer protein TraN [Candidatus Glomeribacter gigasporarum]